MAEEPTSPPAGLDGLGLTTLRGPQQKRPAAGLQGLGYETLRTEFVQRVIGLKGIGLEISPVAPPQVLRKSPAH